MIAARDGHRVLEHLFVDLLLKGAIVVVALVVVVVLGVALWRRLG